MQVFLARQPIFTSRRKVLGYELLFRSGLDNFSNFTDGDQATSNVITNSFLVLGLNNITGGKKAFINFTYNLLSKDIATILPKEAVAVEILEDTVVDEQLLNSCQKLKKLGYTLVLDDFVLSDRTNPLIELADIIKVDFLNTPIEECQELIFRFGRRKKFLAEKVETEAVFKKALSLGYTYFQGYFFSKPVIISGQDVPGYKLNYLRVLQEVNRTEPDLDVVETIIKNDVSLSYKVLRLINSAAFGFNSKIRSIRQAIVLLGIKEFSKWISMMALRGIGTDKPDELVVTSIVRARFAELVAPKLNLKERAPDLFIMGLFSMIDAFLDKPMAEILCELPLAEDVKAALLGEENEFSAVLGLMLAYERGDWSSFFDRTAGMSLVAEELTEPYLKALGWADLVFGS